ncbi:hypothetical protein [Mycobacterium sp.]|uniref:hypothetical protein n=1 Tax=Mycobacterium sp. TaxID=1785 RepID=UPI0011F84DBC|nr:hypothetical protein [Mycobacterium sp.]TAM65682.1 MAG: hypothetical protein EPN51_18220 [Mycobacterium sp.]
MLLLLNDPGSSGSMISRIRPSTLKLKRALLPPLLGDVETCNVPQTFRAGSQKDRKALSRHGASPPGSSPRIG